MKPLLGRWSRWLVIGLGLSGGATGFWAWRGTVHAQGPVEAPRPAPQPARAAVLVAPGIVEPASPQVPLAFTTTGRIVQVLVAEGDHVVVGQTLARLDSAVLSARAAQAKAHLVQASAHLELLRGGARPDELNAARAELEAAESVAEDRERAADRSERLLAKEATSAAESQSSRSSAKAARASAQAAKARLELLQAGTRAESVAEAVAAVAAAREEYAEAAAALDQTELLAPQNGVVLRRFVEPGEVVTSVPPMVVMTLADLEHLQLRVEVDEGDVARVAQGQNGFASADTFGGKRFNGKVVRITQELGRKHIRLDDPRARVDTRVLEVLFGLAPGAKLPLGLRMDVTLETREAVL